MSTYKAIDGTLWNDDFSIFEAKRIAIEYDVSDYFTLESLQAAVDECNRREYEDGEMLAENIFMEMCDNVA